MLDISEAQVAEFQENGFLIIERQNGGVSGEGLGHTGR